MKTSDILRRFWSKIDVRGSDECWPWTASLHGEGYGQFNMGNPNGKPFVINAHILAWVLHHKVEVPAGLEIDHLCRNRICMNWRHLEAVAKIVNILRGESLMAQQARQTHCVAGHLLDEENTYWFGKNKTHRQCRACKRRRNREWKQRNKEAA